jgi:hypothetical protein
MTCRILQANNVINFQIKTLNSMRLHNNKDSTKVLFTSQLQTEQFHTPLSLLLIILIFLKEQNIHCCSTFTVTVGYSIMSIVHSLSKRQIKPMGQCTRLIAAIYKAYQMLTHGRWFFPGTSASSTTKTVRHDIA